MIDQVLTKVINAIPIVLGDEERDIVEIITFRGKSDPTDKAADICAFLNLEGAETKQKLYEALTSHW
jgi:hypothetical protein